VRKKDRTAAVLLMSMTPGLETAQQPQHSTCVQLPCTEKRCTAQSGHRLALSHTLTIACLRAGAFTHSTFEKDPLTAATRQPGF